MRALIDGNARDASPMQMLRTAVSLHSFADPAEAATDRRERTPQGGRAHRPAADDGRAPPPAAPGPRAPRPRPVALLRRELPLHAARRGPDRPARADLRRGDDPPRRARAERIDLHGARGRRHRRRHALRDHRRDLRAQGPDPRRRQRGGDALHRRVRLGRRGPGRASPRCSRRRRRSSASATRST